MKIVVSVTNGEGISKKSGNTYNYANITVNVGNGINPIELIDFVPIPFNIEDVNMELVKTDKGRYMIKELEYQIPWKYNFAFNMIWNLIHNIK